ncbi:MAG: branched-chain amino acid transport system II carrier protein [Sphaerochaetaceae bacterium]|nr:branched-chain amino acid transport system II carrier protein [Sphaerochaetaceae bacterium]
MDNNKRKLTFAETIAVASMLFGMFFGAGNLIFPIHMGQLAGANMFPALIGFLVTAVGMPLLAVVALGLSRENSLFDIAGRVSKSYGYILSTILYLTIGPFFAIPRCATTSYTIGFNGTGIPIVVVTAIFFLIVLGFSLKPNGILNSIGKFLNPAFLFFFLMLIIFSIIRPMSSSLSSFAPAAEYASHPLPKGLIEGYNTMDVIAGLLFGIVVVDVLKGLGIKDNRDIATSTVKSGIYCGLLMALIYAGATFMGASSIGAVEISSNGGIALADCCKHYFGHAGRIILGLIVTLACIKTAIGLVVSIGKAFDETYTGARHYNAWAIGFVLFAFVVSNVGLDSIIKFSIPMLMLLYPLSITLTLLVLFDSFFKGSREVYLWTTIFALVAAVFDFVHAFGITALDGLASKIFPFYSLGLGWVVPSIVGFVVGVVISRLKKV